VQPLANLVKAFAKSYFDFLRMLIVLSALKLVSDKANNWYLTDLYLLSWLVVFLVVLSYTVTWNIRLFVHLPWKQFGSRIDEVINIAVAGLLTGFGHYLVDAAVNALAGGVR
jgi:hypothetical protein